MAGHHRRDARSRGGRGGDACLPARAGAVAAPEVLRATGVAASPPWRRAACAGRPGGPRQDSATGDGRAAHGAGRSGRRPCAGAGAQAAAAAVAGRVDGAAAAAFGPLEWPHLGGRERLGVPVGRSSLARQVPAAHWPCVAGTRGAWPARGAATLAGAALHLRDRRRVASCPPPQHPQGRRRA